jgi:hypothetical protein
MNYNSVPYKYLQLNSKIIIAGMPESFTNQMLRGVSQFHMSYKGQYKHPLLVGKLAKISPVEITREANLSKDKYRYRNQILRIYNNGLRTSRLDSKGGDLHNDN